MNATILTTIKNDLYDRYSHAVDTQTIDRLFDTTYAAHTKTAILDEFIPVLVEREVTEKIEHLYTTDGVFPSLRQRLVFVSRGNRALADAATTVARRLSANNVLVKSATTHPENVRDVQLETVAEERGASLPLHAPETVSGRVLDAADVVVYMTTEEIHDVAGRREIIWDFSRSDGLDIAEVRELADDIAARVHALLVTLGVEVNTNASLHA